MIQALLLKKPNWIKELHIKRQTYVNLLEQHSKTGFMSSALQIHSEQYFLFIESELDKYGYPARKVPKSLATELKPLLIQLQDDYINYKTSLNNREVAGRVFVVQLPLWSMRKTQQLLKSTMTVAEAEQIKAKLCKHLLPTEGFDLLHSKSIHHDLRFISACCLIAFACISLSLLLERNLQLPFFLHKHLTAVLLSVSLGTLLIVLPTLVMAQALRITQAIFLPLIIASSIFVLSLMNFMGLY